MKDEIAKIIHQVLYNPQVSEPPISYVIKAVSGADDSKSYSSEYIDKGDFESYKGRLEEQLIYRLNSLK